MFFSIIIPIYNAEKTLEKCLNSIYSQEFSDYEVLLIDDGSQDSSFAICNVFANKDKRFKPVHQNNQGPSAARNEGLKRAEGKYLCFVDSDDYVMPDYLCRLYMWIKKTSTDVIFFGYLKVDHEGRILASCLPPEEFHGFSLAAELSARDMFGYAWIKCFSRACIEDVIFPEDMSLFEDEIFACSVLEKACRISALHEALYCYVCDGSGMLTGRTYQNYCTLSDRVFSAWEHLLQHVPELEGFLERKANIFTVRCRYYGFERNVDVRRFFASLAETHFFQIHTDRTWLDRMILKRNLFGIKMAIQLYRLKNRLRNTK